jgi:uncharacterized protein (DUF305 family)
MVNYFESNCFYSFVFSRDEAIELADHALTMAKNERIEEFSDLLKDALDQSKTSMKESMKMFE